MQQGLDGNVPDWYDDNITTARELWIAWLRGPSLPALANLKGEFGGLCDTWVTSPLPQVFPEVPPFRDENCV